MTDSLIYAKNERGVVTLTLNRPSVHNAFGDELIQQMISALEQANDDDDVRLLVITGNGKSFSAGADLNWMRKMAAASAEENEQDALRLAQMLRRLNYHSRPTIARINGSAFGGGLGLAACCDIAIATDQAQFALTEVRLGLVPATISPYVFRRIGETQARRYFLTAERFSAEKALQLGLVHEVVEEDQLDQAVDRQVSHILAAGPLAVRHSKKLVFHAANTDVTSQRQIDQDNARLIARLRVSVEGQEGLTAFLEKRTPSWVRENG